MLYATYNDKRWGLPPMTGSKADLAIATRLLSASEPIPLYVTEKLFR